MTTQYNSGRTSGSFLPFLLALVLGAAGVIIFLRHASTGISARLASLITPRATFDTSVPVVVSQIQRLARLETVVYSTDTVVEGVVLHSGPWQILPDALAADKILLVVHGQSIAGVDLGLLKTEDVHMSESGGVRSIQLTLPPSQLFVTTLDNQHTRVYARETGLLIPADQNLESNTRAKAQDQLQKAALADGILDAARKNARATVTTLLYGLGFQQVSVN